MNPAVCEQVRQLRQALEELADGFPDFHFVDVQVHGMGRGEFDEITFDALLYAFVGRDTPILRGAGTFDGVPCFYGDDLEQGLAALGGVTDRICGALRAINVATAEGPTQDLFPIVRGESAPFILAGALLEMAPALVEHTREEFAKLGVPLEIAGAPQVYDGMPVVGEGGNYITFPGEILVRRDPDDDSWPPLVQALAEGRFRMTYAVTGVFEFAAEAFETYEHVFALPGRVEAMLADYAKCKEQPAVPATMARLDRLQRERELVPRQEVRVALGQIAAILRGAGETLGRQFGAAAAEVLHEALDDARKEIDRSFAPGPKIGDSHDVGDSQDDDVVAPVAECNPPDLLQPDDVPPPDGR